MPSDPVTAPPARYLHPATLLFTLGAAAWRLLVPVVAVLFFARGEREEIWLAALFGPAAIAAILKYATFRYAFGPDDLVIRRGLIFRNERHVPYARIQSVDLVQNPLQRLLGVAEVRVQTASGSEAEAVFRVLSLQAVETMRDHVAKLRPSEAVTATTPQSTAGVNDAGLLLPGGAPAAAEPSVATRRLATMPAKEILLYGLISNRGMVMVATALGIVWQLSLWGGETGSFAFDPRALAETFAELIARPAGVVTAILWVAGIIIVLRLLSIVYAFITFHSFILDSADGVLRTATGLFTRVTATIPRHRIQVLTLHETLLHRLFGRVSVRVATAGGHDGETERTQREDWLVPMIRRADLPDLLAAILPDISLDAVQWRAVHPSAFRRLATRRILIAAAILGLPLSQLGLGGIGIAALLAAWIILASWLRARSLGWGLGEGSIAFRTGFMRRATGIARFSKIQAVAWVQSPFDRRRGTATIEADTAGATGAHLRLRMPFVAENDAIALAATLRDGAAGTEFRW